MTTLLLPDFRGLAVVVLGDFVADEYVYGQTDRISREAPVPIVQFERAELKLGAAANVANNLRALGAQVRAVGVLGKDAAGAGLKRACREVGIDTAGLLVVPEARTAVKTRVLAGALHTTRQQLLRLDRGAPLTADQVRKLPAALRAAVRGADALVVSDYGLGSAGAWIAPLCARLARTLPVLVDSRFALSAYHGVTLAKPNLPELRALAGEGALSKVAAAVLRKQALSALLVTRGRDGLSLFTRGAPTLELPVFGPDEAVDVTGAGDTVLAAFAATFASTGALEAAARIANVAGGLVVQKPGTAVVTRTELRAALAGLSLA